MDVKATRRRNIERLIESRFGGNKGKFADFIGRPRPNIYRLLSDTTSDHRSIGEDLARDIEKRLALPNGYLDKDTDASTETIAELMAQIAPILEAAPDDFRKAILDMVLKYQQSPEEGARIQAVIRAMIGELKQ